MLSLLVSLKFACTGCGDPIDVAVQCESQDALDDNAGGIIKIPCPACSVKSQLIFTADGSIHAVTRARTYEKFPEPSLN
jgi:hypothetical protein